MPGETLGDSRRCEREGCRGVSLQNAFAAQPLLGNATPHAVCDSAKTVPPRYRFGAVYLLEPEYTWEEVERDMRAMRDCGFNYLTLWPAANAWLAQRPDELVFTDTLRFLDIAHAHGMEVIVQLIGQNQSQEYAPDCVLRPDMLLVDKALGSVWHNCFWANANHPEVDALVRRYLHACIMALGGHPAVFGWDVFNEAHFRSDDIHTVRLYHTWLRQRYGSIEHLNRKWQRRYSDFSQVNPEDREASYSIWSSVLPAVEFEVFRADVLTDICRRWVSYAREADGGRHPVVVDGTSGQLLAASVRGRNNDEFATAYTCDIFGGTFYPKSWGRDVSKKPWELAQLYGISRAAAFKAGRPYHINELQTHTQSVLTPGSELSPQELSLYIWTALACGAEAMQLWRWRPFLRGYQSTGRGLTWLDGTPCARAEAVAELVRTLRVHEGILTSAVPARPDVAIAVGYRSRVMHDAFLKFGPSHQPDSVRGWYRACSSLGLSVAMTSLEHLDERDMQTPVLVLPSAVALSDGQAAWLERYVANGGCLIAEARLNTVDAWGVVRREGPPGTTLSRVFGVVERDVGPASAYRFGSVVEHVGPASAYRFGDKGDGVIEAPFMTQLLEPCVSAPASASASCGAEVLAVDGRGWPMLTRNRYGKGLAVYFASVQGLSLNRSVSDNAAVMAFLENLFAERLAVASGVSPALAAKPLAKTPLMPGTENVSAWQADAAGNQQLQGDSAVTGKPEVAGKGLPVATEEYLPVAAYAPLHLVRKPENVLVFWHDSAAQQKHYAYVIHFSEEPVCGAAVKAVCDTAGAAVVVCGDTGADSGRVIAEYGDTDETACGDTAPIITSPRLACGDADETAYGDTGTAVYGDTVAVVCSDAGAVVRSDAGEVAYGDKTATATGADARDLAAVVFAVSSGGEPRVVFGDGELRILAHGGCELSIPAGSVCLLEWSA